MAHSNRSLTYQQKRYKSCASCKGGCGSTFLSQNTPEIQQTLRSQSTTPTQKSPSATKRSMPSLQDLAGINGGPNASAKPSTGAPFRYPLEWQDPKFYDKADLEKVCSK